MAPRKTDTKKAETKKTAAKKTESKKTEQKAQTQKGIDKEYIFNLIMPTSAEEEEELEELEALAEEAPAPAADPQPEPASTAQPKPMPRPEPAEEPPEDEGPDSLSLLRERLSRPVTSSVPLRPAKNLVVVNLVEQLVADRLDAAFDKFNCCRCDKCRRDVAALALNALPPQYVVAEPEDIPRLLAEAPAKEIPTALVKAIIQIKNNPQH